MRGVALLRGLEAKKWGAFESMYNVPEMIRDPALFPILRQAFCCSDQAPVITSAKIKLTVACNLRCIMCNYWRSVPEGELSRDEVVRAVAEMQELGLRKIHFSGGELFLRADAVEILCATAARGIHVNLTTNGTLLTPGMVRELVRGRVHSMSVSLDGPDARTQDRIRGQPGAFQATTGAIRLVNKEKHKQGRRLYIRINTVVQKRNYLLQAEMVDLAARLGAVELRPMPVDENPKRRKASLSKEQIEEYNQVVAPEVAARRAFHGFSTHPDYVYPFGQTQEEVALSARGQYARGFYRQHICFVPWLHVFLDWHGKVYLCCMMRGQTPPLGNIRRNSLREIFNGEAYRAVRRRFREERPAICHRCDDFRGENRLLNQELVPPYRPAGPE